MPLSASRMPMNQEAPKQVSIIHNAVPNRIRFRMPFIKNKRTLAELLKSSLMRDPNAKGIYHAEPNIITGSLLIKYHPAFHTEAEVVKLVEDISRDITAGKIVISEKHKNPKLGKMSPKAFFTRELLVDVFGNLISAVLVAVLVSA